MNDVYEATSEINGIKSVVLYSPCKIYRYALFQKKLFNDDKKFLLFILLNPSTATELSSDATLSRCRKKALELGYSAFCICNLFAFRSKNPGLLKCCDDPIGPRNDDIIMRNIRQARQVICAWGIHGTYLRRAENIKQLLVASRRELFHFGLTKNNQPKHPLYLKSNETLKPWV